MNVFQNVKTLKFLVYFENLKIWYHYKIWNFEALKTFIAYLKTWKTWNFKFLRL